MYKIENPLRISTNDQKRTDIHNGFFNHYNLYYLQAFNLSWS